MSALDLVSGWEEAPAARAVVVAGDGRVIDTCGDVEAGGEWASVTKLATALAVLVAVESDGVGLDDPAGPPGATVRHLLAHASGLAFDRDESLAPPGARRIYSSAGFEALAAAVARATGMPFPSYLARAVLDPLGMRATQLAGSPGSGLAGPLSDLARLAGELMAPTVVARATIRAATSTAFPGLAGVLPGFGAFDPLDWGLGFEIRGDKSPHWTGTRNARSTFGHFGASGSFLWVDPEAGLACAVLSDRGFGPWAARAWPALSDAVLAAHAGDGVRPGWWSP